MSSTSPKPIEIRHVYSSNLTSEFSLIRHVITDFPYAAMDTEFPGVPFHYKNPSSSSYSSPLSRSPLSLYNILKTNVNSLNLIQIGLTLADNTGRLPDLNTNHSFIWEFNFSDFDISTDCYDTDAIHLLKKQGTDFVANRDHGIKLKDFAELMVSSGLVLSNSDVTWVTFHSGYDFGYLVRALTGKCLPETLIEFLDLVKLFFGENVFDLKYVMRFAEGLYGGLDKVAKTVGVERVVGKSHQAGSDSLLTWHAFERIRRDWFVGGVALFAGVLYGLEIN